MDTIKSCLYQESKSDATVVQPVAESLYRFPNSLRKPPSSLTKQPFLTMALLRRFYQNASGFHFPVFRNSSKVVSFASSPPVRGLSSYTLSHRVHFSSPPTTRRAAVEVFDPASTQMNMAVVRRDATSSVLCVPHKRWTLRGLGGAPDCCEPGAVPRGLPCLALL
jgi:hypothetical protein